MNAESPLRSELTEEQVAEYLGHNTDFLLKHPDLLDVISIPHGAGGASLIERQVQVLQDKNRGLQSQIDEYHQNAADNESVLRRLHGLYLRLLECTELDDYLSTLIDSLNSGFSCDRVAVYSTRQISPHLSELDPSGADLFTDLFEKEITMCGRMRRDRLEFLFGDEADTIRSAALCSFCGPRQKGLLVLASVDEHRFYPGMGTLFIDLLSQQVCHRIETLGEFDQDAEATSPSAGNSCSNSGDDAVNQ